jgi:hypothetical protein
VVFQIEERIKVDVAEEVYIRSEMDDALEMRVFFLKKRSQAYSMRQYQRYFWSSGCL